MIHSIDYYSFTIPHEFPSIMKIEEKSHEAIRIFSLVCHEMSMFRMPLEAWKPETGARQYQVRLRHETTDITISFGSVNAHLFIECAGKACNTLDAINALLPLIENTLSRATRIDFAVDIFTDCDPRDFSASRNSTSFKSSGEVRTPSGRTNYVGGRASDRMARVYRYEPPHPRSEYLRVEAEYKHDAAKAAAQHLIAFGLPQASLDAHSPFQWTHATWTPENAHSSKIPYKAYRPDNASTVRWLYGDVVTALSKAIKAGLVDLDEWLEFLREGLF